MDANTTTLMHPAHNYTHTSLMYTYVLHVYTHTMHTETHTYYAHGNTHILCTRKHTHTMHTETHNTARIDSFTSYPFTQYDATVEPNIRVLFNGESAHSEFFVYNNNQVIHLYNLYMEIYSQLGFFALSLYLCACMYIGYKVHGALRWPNAVVKLGVYKPTLKIY